MASSKLMASCSALLLAFCLSPKAEASYVLNVVQSGSNVFATGSGTLNTSALVNQGTAVVGSYVWPSFSFGSVISVGPSVTDTFFKQISGPATFGSGPQILASTGSGNTVGVIANDGIYVPSGYVSGSALSSSATWNSETLADLGLTPGTYTWTWGSGATADSFILNIGAPLYYFSQLAFAGGWQTTLTYINYSPQAVTCVTNFYSDAGSPLSVPFSQGTITARTDVLPPGGSVHDPTIASLNATVTEGWAQALCTGPVEAGLLYRLYNNLGVPVGEASVNAETSATTEFATFAQAAASSTGVAYANLSTTQVATITLEAYATTGAPIGSHIVTLGPMAHGASNVGTWVGLSSFTGFVKITSTLPIISLSLNAEAFPVFSSLPSGDLPSTTTLVTP